MPAATRLDRITLTEQQLRATEIMLYRMADLIDRLLADNGVQYTKMQAPVPYNPQTPGAVGIPPAVPITPAAQIVPRSPRTNGGM